MRGVKFVIKLDVGQRLGYNLLVVARGLLVAGGAGIVNRYADVAELVDALASGASASNGVKVQVLSSAPIHGFFRNCRLKWRLFQFCTMVVFIA